MTVEPTVTSPSSGVSFPRIILSRVDLPIPFAPTIPRMPPGGRLNSRPSISVLSPKPFFRSRTSMTLSPRRGPGGMRRSTSSSWKSGRMSCSSLKRFKRALERFIRAAGVRLFHSSSRLNIFSVRASDCFFVSRSLRFCSRKSE